MPQRIVVMHVSREPGDDLWVVKQQRDHSLTQQSSLAGHATKVIEHRHRRMVRGDDGVELRALIQLGHQPRSLTFINGPLPSAMRIDCVQGDDSQLPHIG